MVPFILLIAVFGGLYLLPLVGLDPAGIRTAHARMRVALAAMFLLTGVTHFTSPESFLQMIPEFLPLRREAVYVSGVAELAGAFGLLVPRLRRLAGLGLAAMLVVVFPANVNVAVNNLQIDLYPSSALYQWARLLLQPVLIGLAIWATFPEARPRTTRSDTSTSGLRGPLRIGAQPER
jgi:uncharacterized membrane protein